MGNLNTFYDPRVIGGEDPIKDRGILPPYYYKKNVLRFNDIFCNEKMIVENKTLYCGETMLYEKLRYVEEKDEKRGYWSRWPPSPDHVAWHCDKHGEKLRAQL
jgi:hypothetical protein